MTQQDEERDRQHDDADRRGAGIVELLELDDDQQRRDLGHQRHVAGDEDDRAVLADRAGEGQREAGQQRRQRSPAGSPGGRSAAGWRRGWPPPPRPRGRGPAAPAARVRTTNGRPMKISATQHAERREGDLDAERREQAADPAVRRIERGERDAGHRGRQRERQVDQRVDQALARESRSAPGPRRRSGRTTALISGRDASAAPKLRRSAASTRRSVSDRPEAVQPQRRRPQDQRGQREQHDQAEIGERRSPSVSPKPGRTLGRLQAGRSGRSAMTVIMRPRYCPGR